MDSAPRDSAENTRDAARREDQQLLSERTRLMLPSAIRELLSGPTLRGTPPLLSLGGGLPAREALPFDAVAEAADHVLRRAAAGLQYAPTEGDPRLQPLVAAELTAAFGRTVAPDHVLITTGSQQAIDLLARVLLDPDDVAVVESPTYVGALRALAPSGSRMVPVAVDADGMDTSKLEALLVDGLRPKLCYVVATFSNPSGATLSAERRRHLAELAAHYGFVVVEDDPYHPLRFHGSPLAPVAASSDKVAYLGSFSKVVAPGLRVGYVAGPDWLLRPLVLAKQATDLNTSSLGQALVAHLLERPGWFGSHVDRLRSLYAHRADALLTAVAARLSGQLEISAPPAGGMYAWASIVATDVNAATLAAAALKKGTAVVPGGQFAVDGGFDLDVRLSFSMLSPLELDEAVRRLGAAFAALGAVGARSDPGTECRRRPPI
jgi:2-aminoadipate transaminase